MPRANKNQMTSRHATDPCLDAGNTPATTLRRMLLAKLQPHPLQASFFRPTSEAEDAALLADLRANGQRDPIVVMPRNAAGLPAYTILDGHRRVRLLAALGHKHAAVLVRADLKDADVVAVEMAFLNFNFSRRQLDTMEKAVIATRLLELESNRAGDFRTTEPQRRLRVGKMIGVGEKQVLRFLRIMKTPPEVQHAIQMKLLGQGEAYRIANLTKERQAEVADRIRGVTDKQEVSSIIDEICPVKRRASSLGAGVQRLCKDLSRATDSLTPWISQITRPSFRENLPALEGGLAMLRKLVKRIRAIKSEADPFASIAKLFPNAPGRRTSCPAARVSFSEIESAVTVATRGPGKRAALDWSSS